MDRPVAINCRSLLGRYNSGIGKYITNLCQELDALFREGEGPPVALFSEAPFEGLDVRKVRAPGRSGGIWFDRYTIPRLCQEIDAAALHIPKYVIPSRKTARTVATIHDMHLFRAPEELPPTVRIYWKREIPRTIREADTLIAPSAFTAREMEELFPGAGSRVAVIPHGVQGTYFQGDGSLWTGRYGQYALCVSSIHPRKNIGMLLDAWERCPVSDGTLLILVGHYGWKEPGLLERIRAARNVVWLESLPERDMPDIMAGASAFVFPSSYEGFGMPVLEAMAAGTPVVALDIPVMREVTRGRATLVEADPDSLSEGICSALEDGSNVEAAREAARELTWERSARAHVRAYLGEERP